MAAEDRPSRGRGTKPERKPIFERLAPFAPWDQRAAAAVLDGEAAAQRAGELVAGATAIAQAAQAIAESAATPAVASTLRHLAEVTGWQAGIWATEFSGTAAFAGKAELSGAAGATSRIGEACAALSQSYGTDDSDELVAVAVLGRVLLPQFLADAVLLRAQLGETLPPGQNRWLAILIDDLETQRAELELFVQTAMTAADVERVANACGEVSKTV